MRSPPRAQQYVREQLLFQLWQHGPGNCSSMFAVLRPCGRRPLAPDHLEIDGATGRQGVSSRGRKLERSSGRPAATDKLLVSMRCLSCNQGAHRRGSTRQGADHVHGVPPDDRGRSQNSADFSPARLGAAARRGPPGHIPCRRRSWPRPCANQSVLAQWTAGIGAGGARRHDDAVSEDGLRAADRSCSAPPRRRRSRGALRGRALLRGARRSCQVDLPCAAGHGSGSAASAARPKKAVA
jgi:hypothetical protein